jgi:osmotically-inducible protein OsmY
METRDIKRLPVTRQGTVIGIVSRADLIRALVTHHREARRTATDEKLIREQILDEIAAQDWAAGVIVDVSVRNGTADLWGTVLEAEQAEALRTLVESTPGVLRVEPYLTCNGELIAFK